MAGYSESREISREDPSRFWTLSSYTQKGFDDDNQDRTSQRRIGMSDDHILSGNDVNKWYRHLTGDQPPVTLRDFSSFFDRHPGSTWHRDRDGTLVVHDSHVSQQGNFYGRPEEKQIDFYDFRPWANDSEDRQRHFEYQPQQDFQRFDRERWGNRNTGFNTFSNYREDFPQLQSDDQFEIRRYQTRYENEDRDRQFGDQRQSDFGQFGQQRWGDMDNGLHFRQNTLFNQTDFPQSQRYSAIFNQGQEAVRGGLLNEIRNFNSGSLRHVSRDNQSDQRNNMFARQGEFSQFDQHSGNMDTGFRFRHNDQTDFPRTQHNTMNASHNANFEFHPELMNEIRNFSSGSLRHVQRDNLFDQQRSDGRSTGFQFHENTFNNRRDLEFPQHQDDYFAGQRNFPTNYQRGDMDRDRHYEYQRQEDHQQNTFPDNRQQQVPHNYYETYTPFRFGRNDQFDHRDMVSRQQVPNSNDYGRYGNIDNIHRFDMDRRPIHQSWSSNFQPEQRNYSYGAERATHLKRLQHDEPTGTRRQHLTSGQQRGMDQRPHFGRRQRQERSRTQSQGDQWMQTDLDKIDTHLFDLDLGHHEREGNNQSHYQSRQNTSFEQARLWQPRPHTSSFETGNRDRQFGYDQQPHFQKSGQNTFSSLQGFSGPQHDHHVGRHFEYQEQPRFQQDDRQNLEDRQTTFQFRHNAGRRDDQFDQRDSMSRQQIHYGNDNHRFGQDHVQHQFDTQRFSMDRQPFHETWTRHFQPEQHTSYTAEHPIPLNRQYQMEGRRQERPSYFSRGQHFEQNQRYGEDHQRHVGRRQRQERGRERARHEQWEPTDLDKIDTHLFDLDLGHHEGHYRQSNQSHQNRFFNPWGYAQQHRNDFSNNQSQFTSNVDNRDRQFGYERQPDFQQSNQQGWDDRHTGFQARGNMVPRNDQFNQGNWMNQQPFPIRHDDHFGARGRQQHGQSFVAGGQHFDHGREYGVDHERHIKRRQRQERNRKREQEEHWVHTDLDKIDTHLFDLDLGHHEGQQRMGRNTYSGQRIPNDYYRGRDFYQGNSTGGLYGGFERHQTGGHRYGNNNEFRGNTHWNTNGPSGSWGRHNDAYEKKVNDLGGLRQIINALATDVQHVVPQQTRG